MKKYILWTVTAVILAFPILGLVHGKTVFKKENSPFISEQRGVAIHVQLLSGNESKEQLKKDLISRGVQPVQLTIDNQTCKEFYLSMKDVSLPQVSAGITAEKVARSGIARSLGYKVMGFLFWPFMIPGAIDTLRTLASQNTFEEELQAHTVKPVPEAIPPYSKVERMILVPVQKFQMPFTVTLIDKTAREPLKFEVS